MIGWTAPRQQDPLSVNSPFRKTTLTDPWTAVNILDDIVTAKNPTNAMLFAPVAAYETARAPVGDKVSTFVSGSVGLGAAVGFGALATSALRLVAPVAPMLSGPLGWAAVTVGSIMFAGTGGNWLRQTSHRGMRYLHEHERDMRRLEFGGSYIDSSNARALRQRAITDMSGSFGNARSFIGREAAFLHR